MIEDLLCRLSGTGNKGCQAWLITAFHLLLIASTAVGDDFSTPDPAAKIAVNENQQETTAPLPATAPVPTSAPPPAIGPVPANANTDDNPWDPKFIDLKLHLHQQASEMNVDELKTRIQVKLDEVIHKIRKQLKRSVMELRPVAKRPNDGFPPIRAIRRHAEARTAQLWFIHFQGKCYIFLILPGI